MPKVVDANVILRFLVADSPSQVKKISRLLKDDNQLVLTDVTVVEIVWVLESYYKEPKDSIVEKLLSLLELPNIISQKSLLSQSLLLYQEYPIDYIDAYLIAFTNINKHQALVSYDKSISKVKEINREEP